MSFSIIACIGKNNELGKDNDLVFHFKEDMKFFRETTKGHAVVMGRNTWDSLGGKPLKNRKNYVLTHKNPELFEGATVISDADKFIKENENSSEEIFVIGGARVYEQFLPFSKTLFLTEVDKAADATVYFPTFDKTKYVQSTLKTIEENQTQYKIIKYSKKGK